MRRIFAIWAVCLCWGILNAAPLGPFNATLLEQLKNDYQKGEKEVTRYIELQEKVAEKYIKMTPLSVTAKKKLPPSKDPRDYMTLSPYWWPDSTKIDGLPYIRKDGERNPEVYEYPERENANRFGDAAYCLGVLYYITGKEVYAKACANHLRTWFTDPKLGMNPNMTYAQAVPGMKKMRGSGFIDSRRFSRALGVAKLIEGSKSACIVRLQTSAMPVKEMRSLRNASTPISLAALSTMLAVPPSRSASYAKPSCTKRFTSGSLKVSWESANGSRRCVPAGSRSGQPKQYATGCFIEAVPSCAIKEPSPYSTIECTTDCG